MITCLAFLAMCILWRVWYILRCIFSEKSVWLVVHWQNVVWLYVYMFFFVICNCFHAVLPSIFAVPMREWLGEHSCMSSSFPIAVLDGAFRLMLVFRIFNGCARDPLCMNFTISPFDQRMIHYLIYFAMLILWKVCVTYMCRDKSIVFVVCMRVLSCFTETIVYELHISNNCVFNFLNEFHHFDQLMIPSLIFLAMCILWRVWIAFCAVMGRFSVMCMCVPFIFWYCSCAVFSF